MRDANFISGKMKNQGKRLNSQSDRAFTLIEVLICVAVIGVLVALSFPAWGKVKDNATRNKDANNLRNQALAVFAYAGDHENMLPGRINRGVAMPSTVTASSKRILYLSTVLIDGGYCPNEDGIWRSAVDYGANQSGVAYVVNSGTSSVPSYFFGSRSNTAGVTQAEPKKIVALKANLNPDKYPTSTKEQPLSQIWMITNADGENYSSAATLGLSNSVADNVRTPWGGRNYVYFDGHVEFKKTGDYPSSN